MKRKKRYQVRQFFFIIIIMIIRHDSISLSEIINKIRILNKNLEKEMEKNQTGRKGNQFFRQKIKRIKLITH